MIDNLNNEELLARYLLGDLPEEQQIEIEDRAFGDADYRRNITSVENDLIDEYVRKELPETRRHQFEQHFLASTDRRRRVEFARALATVMDETTFDEQSGVVTKKTSWRDSLYAFVNGLTPAARFSFAATALLVVAGFAWLITNSARQRAELARLNQQQQTDRRAFEQQVETERKRNDELAAQLGQEKEQRQKSEELIDQLQRDVEKPSQSPQNTVFSLALLPGISRSGGARPRLALPESARLVRLQIGLEPEEQYQTFRVEVRTQDGRLVWSRDNLAARTARSGKTVTVTIPAPALSPGEYELALKGVTGNRTLEDVGYYYFDVTRR